MGDDKVKSKIINQSLEESDVSITYNLYIQAIILAVLIILFYIFRPILLWLYSPNTFNRKKHPAFSFNKRSNWFKPLISISDSKLLPLIGLDSFMMLQTMKLLYRICFICGLITTPILCLIYYMLGTNDSETKKQLFLKLSLLNISKDSMLIYAPIIMVYINTLIICYLIFLYYKKFIILRQSFLRNPALSNSIITVKKLQYETGSLERAYDFLNICKRSVFFDKIPSYINTEVELKKYIDSLGLGEVENVELIKEVSYLTKLSYQRELFIRKFEKKIDICFKKIKKISENKALMNKVSNWEGSFSKSIASDSIEEREKVRLFNSFIANFPKIKEKKGNLDILSFYLSKIKKINNEILEEKSKIDSANETNSDIVEIIQDRNVMVEIREYEEEKEFMSIKELIPKLDDFFTDTGWATKSAFVTFKSQHQTSAILQSLISSRPFSLQAKFAPNPKDIFWYNLNLNHLGKYFSRILSYSMFIIFNLMFLLIVIFIAGFAKVERLESIFDFKIPAKFNWVKGTIDGILTPFIYNQLLNLSPVIITIFMKIEGIRSNSQFHLNLMHRYYIFLFFNGFVAFFLSSTFAKTIVDMATGTVTLEDVSKEISLAISGTSVFFFNFSIQKCLSGNFFLLAKPVNLVTNFISSIFLPNRTRRELLESRYPDSLAFSVYYPSLMLVFTICIVYMPIAPIALFVGSVHFFLAYITLKNDFINVTHNEFESGGISWYTCVQIILYSVILLHVTIFFQLFVTNSKFIFILILIPLVLTIYYLFFLKKVFNRPTHYHPISIAEEEILDRFLDNSQRQRNKLFDEWTDVTDEAQEDSVALKDLEIDDKIDLKKNYPYKDIMMKSAYSRFYTPKDFFKILKFIEKNDAENVFGMKGN